MKKKVRRFCVLLISLIFGMLMCACSGIGGGSAKPPSSSQDDTWDGLGELATAPEYKLDIIVDSTAISGTDKNLMDYRNANGSVWFSGVGGDGAGSHWAILDLGKVCNVHKVAITPYLFTDTDSETSIETQRDELGCFPDNISVSYSIERGKETEVLYYADYKPQYEVKQADNGTKYATDLEFGLGGYVTARYVKFGFSGMHDDGLGNFLVKLCALKAYVTEPSELDEAQRVYDESLMPDPYEKCVIDASSVNDADPLAPFRISSLSDGNYGTLWCAEWLNETSPETDEYVEVKSPDGEVIKFTQIVLVACAGNTNMPCGFDMQYSIDDAGFVTAYSYSDYVNPRGKDNTYHVFTFDKPIIADTLRVQFNKKTANAEGYYSVLLGEVEYTAYKVTDAEKETAQAAYQAALGQSDATEYIDDKSVLVLFVCLSAAVAAVGAAVFFIPFERIFKKKEAGK